MTLIAALDAYPGGAGVDEDNLFYPGSCSAAVGVHEPGYTNKFLSLVYPATLLSNFLIF